MASALWKNFMEAPGYVMESPLFPNPFICMRDLIISGSRETYERLPWDGLQVWMNQSMRWIIKSHFNDPTLFLLPICLAILLTLLRLFLSWVLFKRIPKWFKFTADAAEKFPESIWKCLVYSCTWSVGVYIVISGKQNYFFNLRSSWDDWGPDLAIEPLLHWLYMFQMGFYLHCIYATIYMEIIRKDFLVLLTHHILTLCLLFFSYIVRFHKIGLLILVILDIGDVTLEFSKSVFYFKDRGGVKTPGTEKLANICFGIFTVQYILCRIYWYGTKVLYSAMYISVVIFPDGPYYLFFNPMLLALYAMQLYWFVFLLQLLWKILVLGNDLSDNREFEEEDKMKQNGPGKKLD